MRAVYGLMLQLHCPVRAHMMARNSPARPTRHMAIRQATLAPSTTDLMWSSVEAAIGHTATIGIPIRIDTAARRGRGTTKHRPEPRVGNNPAAEDRDARRPGSGCRTATAGSPKASCTGRSGCAAAAGGSSGRKPELCKSGPKLCNRGISKEPKCLQRNIRQSQPLKGAGSPNDTTRRSVTTCLADCNFPPRRPLWRSLAAGSNSAPTPCLFRWSPGV